MTLEERITRLEDIESIRSLQAKYQRCLDTRDFDGLGECFTIDATSSYGNNKMSYQGRDAILEFLTKVMSIHMPSTHLIHGGEVDWIDPNNAKAKWYLEDNLYHDKALIEIHGAAIYSVEYKKIDGKWLISSIGYERIYEYANRRRLLNLFTLHKRTFMKRAKVANPEQLGKYGQMFYYKHHKKKK